MSFALERFDKRFDISSEPLPYLDSLVYVEEQGLKMASHKDIENMPYSMPPIWVKEILAYTRPREKIGSEIIDATSDPENIWRLVDIDPELQKFRHAALFLHEFYIERRGREVIVTPKEGGVTLVTRFYDRALGSDIDTETGIPVGFPREGKPKKYLWRKQEPRVGPIARYIPGFVNGIVDVQINPNETLGVLIYKEPLQLPPPKQLRLF